MLSRERSFWFSGSIAADSWVKWFFSYPLPAWSLDIPKVCLNRCCDQGASDGRMDWLDIGSPAVSFVNWPVVLVLVKLSRGHRDPNIQCLLCITAWKWGSLSSQGSLSHAPLVVASFAQQTAPLAHLRSTLLSPPNTGSNLFVSFYLVLKQSWGKTTNSPDVNQSLLLIND